MKQLSPLSILHHFRSLMFSIKLAWRLLGDRRVAFRLKLIPLASLLYLISPIDLVGDFLFPIFGYADDVVIIIFMLNLFIRLCPADVVAEHMILLRG